jgi:hypothetical protein
VSEALPSAGTEVKNIFLARYMTADHCGTRAIAPRFSAAVLPSIRLHLALLRVDEFIVRGAAVPVTGLENSQHATDMDCIKTERRGWHPACSSSDDGGLPMEGTDVNQNLVRGVFRLAAVDD